MNIKKNRLILIIIFVFLIFLIISGYWFFREKSRVKIDEIVEKEKDIAKLTLSWLNNQKNNEGIYRVNYVCVKREDPFYSTRIFPSVLWGKFKYYEKNLDYDGISRVMEELNLAINTPTQNNQWNCKLMEDLWKSNILSEEQKEKAKNYCRNSGAEGFGDSEMHNVATLNFDELKISIETNINNIISGRPLTFIETYNFNSLSNEFRKVTDYVSNDVVSYLLWKEENRENEEIINSFKRHAFDNYYLSLQGYSVVEKSIEHNSLLGIASLNMYRMTNEKKYHDIALHLFNENKKIELQSTGYDYVYFALFANQFFKITGEELYRTEREKIVNQIIENQFIRPICKDFEGMDGFVLNLEKGGFRSSIGDSYFIKENALMLGLLSI